MFVTLLLFAVLTAAQNDDAPALWEATDGDIVVGSPPIVKAVITSSGSSENGVLIAFGLAGAVLVSILAFCVGVYTGTVIKRNTQLSRDIIAQRTVPTSAVDVVTGDTVFVQSAAQHRQSSAASATLAHHSDVNSVLAGFRVNNKKKTGK